MSDDPKHTSVPTDFEFEALPDDSPGKKEARDNLIHSFIERGGDAAVIAQQVCEHKPGECVWKDEDRPDLPASFGELQWRITDVVHDSVHVWLTARGIKPPDDPMISLVVAAYSFYRGELARIVADKPQGPAGTN